MTQSLFKVYQKRQKDGTRRKIANKKKIPLKTARVSHVDGVEII